MTQSISLSYETDVPVIAQPKTMACWATVAAMLASWQDKVCYPIETVMDTIGSKYRNIFERNTGLSPYDVPDFSTASGLRVEYQMCETPGHIESYLLNYGPIIVITDEDSSQSFCIHARIIVGIEGDGDPNNTWLKIIDPDGGRVYSELFTDFASKYEAMSVATGWNLQLMHY